MTDDLSIFSDTISQSREKFLTAGARLKAKTMSVKLEGEKGPHGEDLYMDACRVGPDDADVVVLTLSGTHGGEGYCGSAVQTEAFSTLSDLPKGVAVLQVHAVNPFGMSHHIRTNEKNVDLNRNWIDFDKELPKNELFDTIYDALPAPQAPSQAVLQETLATHKELIEKHGRWAVDNALSCGQYHRPDAIGFGGEGPQWSRLTLQHILKEMVGPARHITYLDWHTLLRIGNGKLIFLCFNQTGDHLYSRAGSWWGEEAISRETVNKQWGSGTGAAEKRPSRHGLAMWGVQEFLAPQTDVAGAVIEFCTDPHETMSADEMETYERICEQYLQTTRDFTSPDGQKAMAYLKEATSPQSPAFRQGVLTAGAKAFQQALEGAGAWAKENTPAAPGKLQTSSDFS